MRARATALRVLRITAITLVALLLLAFALVQLQQHLFRHRAERLLADFHSIRLNQTTWPEAQAIMQRWGKWGHAHGTCSATDCEYAITVGDTASWLFSTLGDRWVNRLVEGHAFTVGEWLGMDFTALDLRFIVENGILRRTNLQIFTSEVGSGNSLHLIAQGRPNLVSKVPQRIDTPREGGWILGNDEQLDDHPDYKIGAPGACEGCRSEELTYTPELAQSELIRLTSWNLSCLTRFQGCRNLEELAPVMMQGKPPVRSSTWDPVSQQQSLTSGSAYPGVPAHSRSCRTPAAVVGRDFEVIVAVEALSSTSTNEPPPGPDAQPHVVESDSVRLRKMLKGTVPIAEGTVFTVRPYAGDAWDYAYAPEHLLPGQPYLVVLSDFGLEEKLMANSPRCGVFDDTPFTRQQIANGTAKVYTVIPKSALIGSTRPTSANVS